MRNALAALAIVAAAPAFATGLEIEIEGENNAGTVVIDLYEDVAPKHVEQITALAAEGLYDGVVFHRVIDGFMAQTGDVQFGKAGGDMSRAGTGGSDRPDLPAPAAAPGAARAARAGSGPVAGTAGPAAYAAWCPVARWHSRP